MPFPSEHIVAVKNAIEETIDKGLKALASDDGVRLKILEDWVKGGVISGDHASIKITIKIVMEMNKIFGGKFQERYISDDRFKTAFDQLENEIIQKKIVTLRAKLLAAAVPAPSAVAAAAASAQASATPAARPAEPSRQRQSPPVNVQAAAEEKVKKEREMTPMLNAHARRVSEEDRRRTNVSIMAQNLVMQFKANGYDTIRISSISNPLEGKHIFTLQGADAEKIAEKLFKYQRMSTEKADCRIHVTEQGYTLQYLGAGTPSINYKNLNQLQLELHSVFLQTATELEVERKLSANGYFIRRSGTNFDKEGNPLYVLARLKEDGTRADCYIHVTKDGYHLEDLETMSPGKLPVNKLPKADTLEGVFKHFKIDEDRGARLR